MIPLILVDLDGTLIPSSGTVQECVWAAAERLRTAGTRIAVCTGRPCGGTAQRIAKRLGPNNPHIFQNGAMVAYPDGSVVQAFALQERNTLNLIEHARDLSLVLELYTPNTLYVERKTAMSETHARMLGQGAIVRDLEDVVANEPVIRAQWVITPEQLIPATSLQLDGTQVGIATSPVMPNTYFVSVTQAGVTKGTSTRYLAGQLKVNLANVMAVGDSKGDTPMLELVGHPVVMENSPTDLKTRFPRVVGHVERCGVVAAFEEALRLSSV